MIPDELLRNEKIGKLFWQYAYPSIIGMVISGIYAIVDGIFIGRFIGQIGLTAITLAYPLFTFIIATGLIFGIGTSTLASIDLGKEKNASANLFFTHGLFYTLISSIIITVISLISLEFFLPLIADSTSAAYSLAKNYSMIILSGGTIIVFSLFFNSMVRANGSPRIAMNGMILGAVSNILLDALFITQLNWGIKGAAYATLIGEGVSVVYFVLYFLMNQQKLKFQITKIRPLKSLFFKIIHAGFPSFLGELTMSIVIIAHNKLLIYYGGDIAVAAYGIIGYILAIFYSVFIGIGQGMQPLASFTYGSGDQLRLKQLLKISLLSSALFSSIGSILLWIYSHSVINIFIKNDPELVSLTQVGLKIYLATIILSSIIFIISSFLQAIRQSFFATVIVAGKSFFIILPVLFLFSYYWQTTGIWLASPVSDAIILIFSLYFLYLSMRS